ncbi:MAG: MOSC domain-containing protein [Planctomycetes bacterium]|nr:MOSC domain-containing protein [Planctomycetota bacterium]
MTGSTTTANRGAAGFSVASLHVYPLKGAAGFSPQQCPVDERGLRHDRRFMLVDEAGLFISQRECPKMARIHARIDSGMLRIACPIGTSDLPLDALSGTSLRVRIWEDELDAIHVSPDTDALLGDALGRKCRLVWMPDDAPRLTSPKRGEPRRHVSFADAAPLLLVCESALEDLNARMGQSGSPALPMDRFRPNVVVRGGAAAADDHWSVIAIGDSRFRVTNACRRCKVTTIDQTTGESRGAEPLRTLATYRREEDAVTFGQHLLVDAAGTIAVGDAVTVESCGR